MKKLRVAVLMGGPSAEHNVSLKSGRMVLKHLDASRYKATPFIISKSGKWPSDLKVIKRNFDLSFIAMHGEYGEDGKIQELLEKNGLRFTGSSSKASKLGMDKVASAVLFQKAGLQTPPPAHTLPIIIKPSDRGSSLGVSIIKKFSDIPSAIHKALAYSPNIIIQQYISGREFTCGVLEIDGRLVPLPPTEIIPKTSPFFDFNAKYEAGASQEITPPNLSSQKIEIIQRNALTAHKAIGARGFSRTDMIMDSAGKFYILEINTIPGLTKTSLLPQQAKKAGINFPRLLDVIMQSTPQ